MDTKDIVEIQQVIALYGHAADAADPSLIAQVFAEDAVFDAQDSPWGKVKGSKAIAEWFALGKPPHPPAHHVTNVHVYEADGETRVRSKWLVVDKRTGGVVSGEYHDVMVLTAEGWRIKLRVAQLRYRYSFREKAGKAT
jgi:ketosteroid isomerase-like protein